MSKSDKKEKVKNGEESKISSGGESGDKCFFPQIVEEDLNVNFEVGAPEERGSHMEYMVKGEDRQGPWSGARRFSQFYELSDALQQRWPGIFLPRLPPKKAIGRYETRFLQERRYYLERYLRKIGQFEYIINA